MPEHALYWIAEGVPRRHNGAPRGGEKFSNDGGIRRCGALFYYRGNLLWQFVRLLLRRMSDPLTDAGGRTRVRDARGLFVRAPSGARAFRLGFALSAVLIALCVTLSSGAIVTWPSVVTYAALTLLAILLIGWLVTTIERSEREAPVSAGAPRQPRARGEKAIHSASGTCERLAQMERVVIRQHRFVADAAHELRTPLTAQTLVGENVLLMQGPSGVALREAIASMLEESRHMRRLIDGLLDLTRVSQLVAVERGISRHPFPLDLNALVGECVESLRILAEEKQQVIELHATDSLWADADPTMVRQALLNVIHNSLEHCPSGSRIEVSTAQSSPDEAVVHVQDDGPGIPAQEQSCVFERFYRGGGASRKRGLGLGLSIAKAVLSSQGGGIDLCSSPGTGCCFIVTLPSATSEPLIKCEGGVDFTGQH